MAKVKAFALAELPLGKMKEVDIDGELILFLHMNDGVFAVNGICTHAHVHLAGGWVEGENTICCPQHGGKFDVQTGKAIAFPAVTGLEIFPVSVEEGMVFVDVDD